MTLTRSNNFSEPICDTLGSEEITEREKAQLVIPEEETVAAIAIPSQQDFELERQILDSFDFFFFLFFLTDALTESVGLIKRMKNQVKPGSLNLDVFLF